MNVYIKYLDELYDNLEESYTSLNLLDRRIRAVNDVIWDTFTTCETAALREPFENVVASIGAEKEYVGKLLEALEETIVLYTRVEREILEYTASGTQEFENVEYQNLNEIQQMIQRLF